MPQSSTYDIALVLDNVRRWLPEAKGVLARLRAAYPTDDLRALDVSFFRPSTLVAVLRFEPARYQAAWLSPITELAHRGHFRVLKPMVLSEDERAAFYGKRLEGFAWRRLGVEDVDALFLDLDEQLRAPTEDSAGGDAARVYAATFVDAAELLGALGGGRADALDVYVETDQPPELGSQVRVALETATGQGPALVSAIVARVSNTAAEAPADKGVGFTARVSPEAGEKNLFEAFLIALRRGAPWPERSGRRYERFPMRLCVEYDHAGARSQHQTHNLSRGGLFIDTPTPPPLGADLQMRLFRRASEAGVRLAGRVVYSVDSHPTVGARVGAGVRFTESAPVVKSRLDVLLAATPRPRARRALVVDDDAFWRTVMHGELSRAGFEVLEAEDGTAGLRCLLDELLQLDVLVLDIFMPGLSGEELVHKVRTVGQEQDLAIVFLTGALVSGDERQRYRGLGVDDVIPKFESADEIIGRIETAVAAARQRRGEEPLAPA